MGAVFVGQRGRTDLQVSTPLKKHSEDTEGMKKHHQKLNMNIFRVRTEACSLLREVVDTPSLDMFKVTMDGVLSNLV